MICDLFGRFVVVLHKISVGGWFAYLSNVCVCVCVSRSGLGSLRKHAKNFLLIPEANCVSVTENTPPRMPSNTHKDTLVSTKKPQHAPTPKYLFHKFCADKTFLPCSTCLCASWTQWPFSVGKKEPLRHFLLRGGSSWTYIADQSSAKITNFLGFYSNSKLHLGTIENTKR